MLCSDVRWALKDVKCDVSFVTAFLGQKWTNISPQLWKSRVQPFGSRCLWKQSQTWTHHSENLTDCSRLTKCKQFQHWNCLYVETSVSKKKHFFSRGESCLFLTKWTKDKCPLVEDISLPDFSVSLRPFWLDRHVARAAEPRGATGSRHSGHVAYITVRGLGRQVVWAPWISARTLQPRQQMKKNWVIIV